MNLLQISYRGVYIFTFDGPTHVVMMPDITLNPGDFVIDLKRDRMIGSWKAILVLTSHGVGWISEKLADQQIGVIVSRAERMP